MPESSLLSTGQSPSKRPDAAEVAALWEPLMDQAREEVMVAMRVAFLKVRLEWSHTAIAERLDLSPKELRAALARIEQVAPHFVAD